MNICSFVVILALAIARAEISNPDLKIVGGTDAFPGQASYQVSLRDSYDNHFCGGAIINNRWIVTAAHCLGNVPAYMWVGSIYLTQGGTKYYPLKSIRHNQFTASSTLYDIAMIKTTEKILFGEYVQPLTVPLFPIQDDTKLNVTGWGLEAAGNNWIPDNLQILTTTSLNFETCQSIWGGDKISSSQLCTYTQEGEGFCMGDSGGPVVYGNELHGIVSWGSPCATGLPDVSTKVASYNFWIWWTQITNLYP